jgi:multiple sugar transport system permease protein
MAAHTYPQSTNASTATSAPAPASASRPQPALVKGTSARRTRELGLGYALLAPALTLALVFEVFPILYGAYISLCDWRLSCTQFVGLDNYGHALADPQAWQALGTTALYSLIAVPMQLGIGLFLAVVLFQKIRGQEAFRVLLFLPYITSTVASAAVWSYLYSPDNGPINGLLRAFGLPAQRWLAEPRGIFDLVGSGLGLTLPGWASGPSLALLALIIFTTWVFVGYETTIFMAGLSTISPELYDAAHVDGASAWQSFRNITLPLLSPTTFFLLVFTIIGTFKAFNHIYIMTQGGPGTATTTASILIFQQLYRFNRYGYSAALSFLLFSVILVLTVVQQRTIGRRVVHA